jgi:hypothetical protein
MLPPPPQQSMKRGREVHRAKARFLWKRATLSKGVLETVDQHCRPVETANKIFRQIKRPKSDATATLARRFRDPFFRRRTASIKAGNDPGIHRITTTEAGSPIAPRGGAGMEDRNPARWAISAALGEEGQQPTALKSPKAQNGFRVLPVLQGLFQTSTVSWEKWLPHLTSILCAHIQIGAGLAADLFSPARSVALSLQNAGLV